MWRYLKAAFWARADLPMVGPLPLNALAVFGCGVIGGVAHAAWLVGVGLETAYLYLLVSNPRFQTVVAARDHWQAGRSDEQNRRDGLARLPADLRDRAEQVDSKIRRAAGLGGQESDADLLRDSNRDALEKLGALHLRLLGAECDLRTAQEHFDEAGLVQQAAALERELQGVASPLSAALRESKQATLALTKKRLANARRRAESLAEVRSDLARIEAQVELALEEASQEGRPTLVASNLNLLNRILESNRALSNHQPSDPFLTRQNSKPGVVPGGEEQV